MYDFILKINPNNSINPYTDNNYFENKYSKIINYRSEWYQLYGQSFNNNESFYFFKSSNRIKTAVGL